MSPVIFILGGGVLLLIVVILVVVGIRMPQGKDPIQERLAEFSMREVPMTLEEIEMSLGFHDRIVLPFFNRIGQFAMRFTPQATLESTRTRLEMAGNPLQMDPAFLEG